MTALEIAGFIAALITAISTALTAVYVIWWRDRPSTTIPGYAELKASLDDPDTCHWVRVSTALSGPPPVFDPRGRQRSQGPPSRSGKVVKLTRTAVTLDHPWFGNQTVVLAAIHGVIRENWPREADKTRDWVPRHDSDRRGDSSHSLKTRLRRFRATRQPLPATPEPRDEPSGGPDSPPMS